MADGIRIHVLGDHGPYSRNGKSISYLVSVGSSNFLLDCGAPLFQQIGGFGLKDIKGLIITHCHDDHKRWFTDLALFHRYAPDLGYKIFLVCTEEIHANLKRSSGPALERGLTADSRLINDISFDEYIDHQIIGPKARFRIDWEGCPAGKGRARVVDEEGKALPPERGKVVINPRTGTSRMLLKDPDYEEWVEPSSFYPFSSGFFYGEKKNVYRDGEGFTIEAINAPVWHGLPAYGMKISTGEETVIFSSDTVRDQELWKSLSSEKRTMTLGMPEREFESLPVIHGDINDYIERIWSRERYEDAVHAFEGAVGIHDVAIRDSVVHTHYRNIGSLSMGKDRLLLTHAPDRMTSEWAMLRTGKTFKIKGKTFFELVGEEAFLMDGDIYHKESGDYFVGYRNDEGRHTVFESEGVLGLAAEGSEFPGKPLYKVDLYQDLSGKYFPVIEESDAVYRERDDGQVELVRSNGRGSVGKIVKCFRKRARAQGQPVQ